MTMFHVMVKCEVSIIFRPLLKKRAKYKKIANILSCDYYQTNFWKFSNNTRELQDTKKHYSAVLQLRPSASEISISLNMIITSDFYVKNTHVHLGQKILIFNKKNFNTKIWWPSMIFSYFQNSIPKLFIKII